MILFILLVLTSVHWTKQHLTYPINYCQLAAVCTHDHSMVCAATEDGCNRRTFLDQCDMYEYNCDFGARCRETYKQFCLGPDLDVRNPPPLSDHQPKPKNTATNNNAKHTMDNMAYEASNGNVIHTINFTATIMGNSATIMGNSATLTGNSVTIFGNSATINNVFTKNSDRTMVYAATNNHAYYTLDNTAFR
ncbi:hypothetical protein PYW08_008650 [Mythimna loreyi]|uniref:Uncharacterized protein n=1 Tax=Mythimna loreyi TaxID=667449 RepID=A0ACC2Q915_9NEOP|nr:hypothetical protein PYW08_008650 [Mythimna loreyi]